MDWKTQLNNCATNIDRACLAKSADCHPELLRLFLREDLDPLVVEEAACNPHATLEDIHIAKKRFPHINTRISEEVRKIESLTGGAVAGDRDQIILKHITEVDNVLNHENSHLGELKPNQDDNQGNPVVQWAPTQKYRIAMIMAPAWGVSFPPYNIAKLTGILRSLDYSVKVCDLNIDSYHYLKNLHNEDYWRGERYFLWSDKTNFNKILLPLLKPLFDNVISEIVADKPRVIGFSIYNTNIHAVTYIIETLKKLLPDACYIAGGPEVVTTGGVTSALRLLPFNYLFVGEAEETFPHLLEHLPKEYPVSQFIGSTDSKLELENYAYPDYSDYNLNYYTHTNGVSIETSRGCVAQCSFCSETYFWKFRSATPERVINEMEYQIQNHNVQRFWFVDSLVNGNLKNFQRLVDLMIEKKLNIKWNSYARCDGRMDKKFIQKIVDSGCSCLSYGVESGSQKVLLDMRKKIEIWEIENNLNDGASAGLFNHVNWVIGFPTEEPIDFLHSLQLLYNLKNSINVISPGFGAGPAAGSHMSTNWKEYGIEGDKFVGDKKFLNNWYTTNYQNTLLHRFIRIKLFHVWLEIMKDHANSTIENSQRYNNIKTFYKFKAFSPELKKYVKYDHYVKLDRLDSAEFKNSITNEFFTICYALYLHFGACSFNLVYNPQADKNTFGIALVNNYSANINFNVDDVGNYTFSIIHNFQHTGLTTELESIYFQERKLIQNSFQMKHTESGNIGNWVSDSIQTKETVHEQYRNKPKRVIPIAVDKS